MERNLKERERDRVGEEGEGGGEVRKGRKETCPYAKKEREDQSALKENVEVSKDREWSEMHERMTAVHGTAPRFESLR